MLCVDRPQARAPPPECKPIRRNTSPAAQDLARAVFSCSRTGRRAARPVCSCSRCSCASIKAEIELVAEIEAVSAARPQEIQHLVPRHATGPVDETLRRIELRRIYPTRPCSSAGTGRRHRPDPSRANRYSRITASGGGEARSQNQPFIAQVIHGDGPSPEAELRCETDCPPANTSLTRRH